MQNLLEVERAIHSAKKKNSILLPAYVAWNGDKIEIRRRRRRRESSTHWNLIHSPAHFP